MSSICDSIFTFLLIQYITSGSINFSNWYITCDHNVQR